MAVFDTGHYIRMGEALAHYAGLELETTSRDWTAMTTSRGKVTVTLKTLLVLDEAEYNDIFNKAKETK